MATSAVASSAFPTANLVPDEALVCPGHGVYACVATTPDAGGARRPSASACARPSRPVAAS